jgi:hypothetical protein
VLDGRVSQYDSKDDEVKLMLIDVDVDVVDVDDVDDAFATCNATCVACCSRTVCREKFTRMPATSNAANRPVANRLELIFDGQKVNDLINSNSFVHIHHEYLDATKCECECQWDMAIVI